jgi:uncharacterized protein (TIGR04222 family)
MDWLFHNPVADLSGPAFLALYALFAVAVIVVSRMQIAAADTSLSLPLPAVSVDGDPYEIAYLRGGGNELLRFAIFDLIRQGYLRICDPPKKGKPPAGIEQTGLAGAENLSELQRAIVAWYAAPHTTRELFASALPAAAAAFGAATFQPRLEAEGFYTSPQVRSGATLVRLYGALGLSLLVAYRLYVAIVKGHNNVGFLAFLAVFALVALLLLTLVPRLSRRGRAFLQRLETALRPAPLAPAIAGAAILPIAIAATGLAALAGTEYAPMSLLFPRQTSAGSSRDCSGGCGSSGSSGSCSGGSSCGGGGCGG